MASTYFPTGRDVEIIRYVHRYRLLKSRSHILPLFGESEHVLRRLQKLTEHGYLFRLPSRRPHEQAVYALGNKGSDLMASHFGAPRPKVDWPSQNRTITERHVEHTLFIADLMVAIELACGDGVRYVSPEEILERYAPERTRNKAHEVGGKPFRWRIQVREGEWHGSHFIEPDWMFGLDIDGAPEPSFFFLEADRGTMSVKPTREGNLDKSSLFKKMLQYWSSWQPKSTSQRNAFEERFGIQNIRTLFALSTGARGAIRLEECMKANEFFGSGSGGTGLFLFAKKETLLEAPDILRAPLLSGRRKEKTLLG